jgi:hypothetical protein
VQWEEPEPHDSEIHKIVRDNLRDGHLDCDSFREADEQRQMRKVIVKYSMTTPQGKLPERIEKGQ